jgi:hypothetical protein
MFLALFLVATLHDKRVCSVRPDECREIIATMTDTEKKDLADADAAVDKARDNEERLAKQRDAIANRIVKQHGMSKYPAIVDHRSSEGLWEGTCLGSISFNKDGFVVYHPASDIERCVTK